MASTTHSDIEAFRDFLNQRIGKGVDGLSPEEAVREFRAYQDELSRFIAEAEVAVEQGKRGQYAELDVDAVLERVRERLAKDQESNG